MELMDKYNDTRQEIFDYFGYVEDWVVIPLDDATEYFWSANNDEVNFSEIKENVTSLNGQHYCNEIYKQRFLDKWVYRGEYYTMIVVDTRVDGNKFLQIFDNKKELLND